MANRLIGLTTLAAAIVVVAIGAKFFFEEKEILDSRQDALHAASSAYKGRNYAAAVANLHRFFELHPKFPDIANEKAALNLLDKSMARWVMRNVAVEEEKFVFLKQKYEELEKKVHQK